MSRTFRYAMLFVLMAATANALATTIDSDNAVGVLPVAVTGGGDRMVSVPFAGEISLVGLSVGSFAYFANGDHYDVWQLDALGAWQPLKVVTVDGDGSSSQLSSSVMNFPRGESFWIGGANDETAYLVGDEPSGASLEIALSAGLNLVGNPATTNVNLIAAAQSPSEGDRITVSASGGGTRTYTYSGSSWRYRSGGQVNATNKVELAPGEGCWYRASSAGKLQWR